VPTRFRHLLPPHLLALIVGTLAGTLVFTEAPRLGPIDSVLPTLQAFTMTQADMNTMLFAALSIALLGSIDSLLASMAADAKTHTYHNSDRELMGQGLGNLVAGLFGAVPGAGATVRTMTNIHWGGRTRLSGVVCSGTLLLTLLIFSLLLERIPVAVLSGILIKVALDIIDWRYLRRARTAPRTGLTLMFTVMALTVVFNLVLAVAVGVIAASLLFVKRMADVELEAVKTFDNTAGETSLDDAEARAMDRLTGQVFIIRFSGPMSFGAANRLHRRLAGYENYQVLILDLRDVSSADSSAVMALENIINNARDDNHTVILVGLNTTVARKFALLGVLDLIRDVERYQDLLEALDYAAKVLNIDVTDQPAEDATRD
jgi:SulP family sulfate permease